MRKKTKEKTQTAPWPVTVTMEVLTGVHAPQCPYCNGTWKRTDKDAALCPNSWHDEEGPFWKTFTVQLHRGDSYNLYEGCVAGSHDVMRVKVT